MAPIAAKLDDTTIPRLNAQVEVGGTDPEQVARKFLKDNGFIS